MTEFETNAKELGFLKNAKIISAFFRYEGNIREGLKLFLQTEEGNIVKLIVRTEGIENIHLEKEKIK